MNKLVNCKKIIHSTSLYINNIKHTYNILSYRVITLNIEIINGTKGKLPSSIIIL